MSSGFLPEPPNQKGSPPHKEEEEPQDLAAVLKDEALTCLYIIICSFVGSVHLSQEEIIIGCPPLIPFEYALVRYLCANVSVASYIYTVLYILQNVYFNKTYKTKIYFSLYILD